MSKSEDHNDAAYFEKEVWTLQRAIKRIDTERRAEPDFPKQGSYLDDFLM